MIKLVITIILFIGSGLSVVYLVYPGYENYQNQLEKNEILEEELENITFYVRDVWQTLADIEEKEQELSKMKTAFPEDHDAPSFYIYLDKKIKEHNLENDNLLGSFSVRPHRRENEEHPRIKEVSFPLSVTGRYDDIQNFLKDTESLIRIINITDINISSASGEEESDWLSVTFTANTYSY